MASYRKTGKRNIQRVLAGSALAKGDIVQTIEATGSRTVDNAATNASVYGILEAAIASAESGQADMLSPGEQVWVQCQNGSVMAESYIYQFVDIYDETGVDLAASSNKDFLVLGWDGVTPGWCYGVFVHLDVSVGT